MQRSVGSVVIVVANEATPVERTAARELRHHLAKVTGAALPVVSEAEAPPGAPRVVVGDGPLTRRLLPGFDPARFAPDAIGIKTVGPDLVLAGRTGWSAGSTRSTRSTACRRSTSNSTRTPNGTV